RLLYGRRCAHNHDAPPEVTPPVDKSPPPLLPLSAACRCASRPPSDPTVFIPTRNPVRNGWVLPHFGLLFSSSSIRRAIPRIQIDEFHFLFLSPAGDEICHLRVTFSVGKTDLG